MTAATNAIEILTDAISAYEGKVGNAGLQQAFSWASGSSEVVAAYMEEKPQLKSIPSALPAMGYCMAMS